MLKLNNNLVKNEKCGIFFLKAILYTHPFTQRDITPTLHNKSHGPLNSSTSNAALTQSIDLITSYTTAPWAKIISAVSLGSTFFNQLFQNLSAFSTFNKQTLDMSSECVYIQQGDYKYVQINVAGE